LENREPKIISFLCKWCSYAGAYPPNSLVIRVPCSGRVNPLFIIRAFSQGADGVLVAGCHPGDCHYAEGNYYARRRLQVFRELLSFMGIDKRRFRLEWVSASEAKRFADLIKEFTREIKELGTAVKP